MNPNNQEWYGKANAEKDEEFISEMELKKQRFKNNAEEAFRLAHTLQYHENKRKPLKSLIFEISMIAIIVFSLGHLIFKH